MRMGRGGGGVEVRQIDAYAAVRGVAMVGGTYPPIILRKKIENKR